MEEYTHAHTHTCTHTIGLGTCHKLFEMIHISQKMAFFDLFYFTRKDSMKNRCFIRIKNGRKKVLKHGIIIGIRKPWI
jgi:hypothetical protein